MRCVRIGRKAARAHVKHYKTFAKSLKGEEHQHGQWVAQLHHFGGDGHALCLFGRRWGLAMWGCGEDHPPWVGDGGEKTAWPNSVTGRIETSDY
jgi:hypothetical protein